MKIKNVWNHHLVTPFTNGASFAQSLKTYERSAARATFNVWNHHLAKLQSILGDACFCPAFSSSIFCQDAAIAS